jgi:signal transduction histidine kinase
MLHTMKFYRTLAFQIVLPIVIFIALVAGVIGLMWYHVYLPNQLQHHESIIALLGVGIIWFVVSEYIVLRHYLFSPLAEFKNHIQEIANGNYEGRTYANAQNEFVALVPALNHMSKKLSEQNSKKVEDLQKVVEDLNNSTKLLIQRDLELTRANDKLKDLDKMKSEFVSLATHQLRTPLSGVRWSLSMLLNGEMGELTPEQKLYVMKTYESNNRMISLINDMLQADRVEGGTLKFKFTPTNLIYLFDNILVELRQLAGKRNVTLEFKAESDIPPLMIDAENMRIVLQNLIDNAVKYSKVGGDVQITVGKTENVV